MQQNKKDVWQALEQTYAFLGNSLLSPMTQTSDVGISVAFWEEFPKFDNEYTRLGLSRLIAYAQQAEDIDHEKAVERCSVEYTKLFVGPPSPAAPPWETMNKGEEQSVGFGQATFEMKQLLREVGFELTNQNHQYEDHIGIELLYLSVLCKQAGENLDDASVKAMKDFINEHPLSWIEVLYESIENAFPQGYFISLLKVVQGVLVWHNAYLAD